MRHYLPLIPSRVTACGMDSWFHTAELDLVTCADCRMVVLRAEILGGVA